MKARAHSFVAIVSVASVLLGVLLLLLEFVAVSMFGSGSSGFVHGNVYLYSSLLFGGFFLVSVVFAVRSSPDPIVRLACGGVFIVLVTGILIPPLIVPTPPVPMQAIPNVLDGSPRPTEEIRLADVPSRFVTTEVWVKLPANTWGTGPWRKRESSSVCLVIDKQHYVFTSMSAVLPREICDEFWLSKVRVMEFECQIHLQSGYRWRVDRLARIPQTKDLMIGKLVEADWVPPVMKPSDGVKKGDAIAYIRMRDGNHASVTGLCAGSGTSGEIYFPPKFNPGVGECGSPLFVTTDPEQSSGCWVGVVATNQNSQPLGIRVSRVVGLVKEPATLMWVDADATGIAKLASEVHGKQILGP